MRFHFAPVGGIHVRRQHHKTGTAGGGGGLRDLDRLRGAQRRDACDDGRLAVERGDERVEDGDFFVEAQRGTLAERAERDEAGAAVFDEPLAVLGDEGVIDAEVGMKGRGDGGNDAGPVHVSGCGG